MESFGYDSLSTSSNEETFSRLSSNSEEKTSKLLQNLEDMILRYNMQNNISCKFKYLTTQ